MNIINLLFNGWLELSHWIIIIIFVLISILILFLTFLLAFNKNQKTQRLISITGIVIGVVLSFLLVIGFCAIIGEIYKAVESTEPGSVNVTETGEGDVYYLGILPLRKPTTMLERFSGVKKYLTETTGLNIELRLYSTAGDVGGYTAVVRDIANGDIDFAYLASVTTVQANGNGPVIPFACAQKNGSPTYQGDLVVRANSAYRSLEDLKGRKVSGTSKSSTSGNLMPLAMLKQRGINQETYFDGGMMYLGSHDKAAEAVLAGTIDGAFINEATLNKYNKDGLVLRSVWRHNPVPEFPFVVNTNTVAPDVLTRVEDALLKMHETNISGIQAVNEKYEKWVEINWEDYLGIKDAIDEVHGEVFYNLNEWGN